MSKKIGIKKCYLFVLMMILLCIMNLNTKAGDDITVSVSSSEAIIGNEVEVVLNISNGLDIGAYEFTISYDKNIFDYIECVTALNTMAMSAIESENGIHISAILNEDINSKEVKEVLKIKFKVKNNVEKGKYPISILEGFIVDKHTGEGLLFNTVDGNISVGNEILGDVDGNGKVNIADAMIVFRIVAGKTVDTAYDVDNLGDVNSDSTINIVDAMMLFHFVSDRIDEFVETGKNNTDGELENTETEELTSEKETTKEITEEETMVEVQITTEEEATTEEQTTAKEQATTKEQTATKEQATTKEQTTTEKQTTTKNETDKETIENKEEYTTEKETTRSEESTTENIIIDVTDITLSKTELSLKKGAFTSLEVYVYPDNASDKTVVWSSSNTAVVSVNSYGKVTAIGNGTAIITAKSNSGGAVASCKVTVTTPVTSIILDKTSVSLNQGETVTLIATLNPIGASNKEVLWDSSNASVATVDKSGKVVAVGNGTAIITVTTVDGGKVAECKVTVNTPVTGVNIDVDSITMIKNGSYSLNAIVSPTNASNKTLTWSSSNTSVATVNSQGVVTAKGNGTAIITVTSNDGKKTDTCTVVVKTSAYGISLNKTNMTLNKGATATLVATITPKDASDKSIVWTSSNTSVATVDSTGKVTAKGNGTASIVAKLKESGISVACNVTVVTPVTGVTLNKTSVALNKGGTVTLVATVNPTGASNKTVTWSSSNTAVATVNGSGKVTAVGNGTATITVKTQDGSKTATCTVTVKTPVTGITLNKTSVALNKGGTVTLVATVNPTGASNKTVTWSSSNTAVATVTNAGKITAKGNGTATITVKTQDGSKTATCKVTVTTPVTGISITNKTDVMLDIKGTYQCKTSIAPTTASNKNVTWSSSDSTIAKVDSNGKITGLKPGIATITVKTADGGYTDNIKVYVYKTNAQIPAGGNTWYRISIASTTNRVMEVNNGSTFNGAKVQLNSSNGSIAQLWQFHDYISTNGGVAIVPKCNSNGYILDVNRGTSYSTPFAENNLIDVWMIGEDNAASMWQLVKLWDGSYIFKLINTDWVAGVTSTAAGAQLMLRKFDLTDMNQRWFLEAVDTTGGKIDDTSMNNVVSKAGKQIDYKYADSKIMCSAYCITYVRGYLYNDYTAPINYWSSSRAEWSSGGGTWRTGNVLNIAKQYIDKGKPVIIHVNWATYGTHYVVAYSYTGSGNTLSDYKVLDPWDGKIKSLSSFSLYGDNQIITFE